MTLSTGKEVYANGEIFGLTRDFHLTEGYDSYLYEDSDDRDEPLLTREEKREIADRMIERWQTYRGKL